MWRKITYVIIGFLVLGGAAWAGAVWQRAQLQQELVLYLILLTVVSLVMLVLIINIFWHSRQARRKHSLLLKEIREAEESVRRGFAVLRRDIEAELDVIHQARLTKALGKEEQEREQRLLQDLANIEKYISREVWEVEQAEQS